MVILDVRMCFFFVFFSFLVINGEIGLAYTVGTELRFKKKKNVLNENYASVLKSTGFVMVACFRGRISKIRLLNSALNADVQKYLRVTKTSYCALSVVQVAQAFCTFLQTFSIFIEALASKKSTKLVFFNYWRYFVQTFIKGRSFTFPKKKKLKKNILR